jgi:hypothetical protein
VSCTCTLATVSPGRGRLHQLPRPVVLRSVADLMHAVGCLQLIPDAPGGCVGRYMAMVPSSLGALIPVMTP